jgi:dTDP-4-dehydrorhamnose reductase
LTRLLVTGASGYLGGELCRAAAARGLEVTGTFLSTPPAAVPWRAERLDVRAPDGVAALVRESRPDWVVHAAYRQDGPGARETIVAGSRAVAAASAAVGARLVHVSSDMVFDGEGAGAYREEDEPAPVLPYGAWKLAAEGAVADAYPGALLVRTSLLYGGEPGVPLSRHERLVLEAARGRAEAVFFTDEIRSPVALGDLVAALLELAGRGEQGVLHVAGRDHLSRHELAVLVARAHALDPAVLRTGRSAGAGSRRPRNCALDSGRARALLRTRLRGAREVLAPDRRCYGQSRSSRQASPARV